MKAEYFPPKEDIILQNEAPTDLYILVNGAVVLSLSLSLCMHGCVCVSSSSLFHHAKLLVPIFNSED